MFGRDDLGKAEEEKHSDTDEAQTFGDIETPGREAAREMQAVTPTIGATGFITPLFSVTFAQVPVSAVIQATRPAPTTNAIMLEYLRAFIVDEYGADVAMDDALQYILENKIHLEALQDASIKDYVAAAVIDEIDFGVEDAQLDESAHLLGAALRAANREDNQDCRDSLCQKLHVRLVGIIQEMTTNLQDAPRIN